MFAPQSSLLQAVFGSPAFSRVSGRQHGSPPLAKNARMGYPHVKWAGEKQRIVGHAPPALAKNARSKIKGPTLVAESATGMGHLPTRTPLLYAIRDSGEDKSVLLHTVTSITDSTSL